MGCVQTKNQSPVVLYENAMGATYASISGKDIQTTQIIIAGITTSGDDRIFAFDILQQKFKALSMPQGMQLWNYSSIVQLSDKEIMITGGLSQNASEISSLAFIYDSAAGRAIKLPNMTCPRYTHMSTFLKGKLYVIGGRDYGEDDNVAIRSQCERFNFHQNRWEKISRLNVPRCTGFTYIYKDSIYVCGGLTGKMHRSRIIERFDESNDRWIKLDFKLSRGMECGTLLAASHYFADPVQAKDKFVILGGNTEEGSQDSVFVYNLADSSVISAPSLNQRRVLQKTIAHQQKIIVFGGSESDGIEVFDAQSTTWNEVSTESFSLFVQPEDIDLFAYSQPPVVISDFVPPVNKMAPTINQHQSVDPFGQITKQQQNDISSANASRSNSQFTRPINKSNPSINDVELVKGGPQLTSNRTIMKMTHDNLDDLSSVTKSLIKEDLLIEKAYLFGTDVDPFILEIDFLNIRIDKKPVPLSMRLFNHQGVARPRTSPQRFILMGGVHDGLNKTVGYTYAYDPVTHTAKRLPKMPVASYAFAIVQESYSIYVIGGKQSIQKSNNNNNQQQEEDVQSSALKSATILSACQRFDCNTNEWYNMPSLNVKRVSAMATVMFKKIFVFGGFKGESDQVRPNEIEVFDPQAARPAWQILQARFPIGLEGAHLLHSNSEQTASSQSVLLFGGRTSSGEIKFISKLTIEKPEGTDEQEQQEHDLQVKIDKIGQMRQSRCLHKLLQPYRSVVLVLGGQHDPLVECVKVDKDYESSAQANVPHIDALVQKLTIAIKKTKDSTLKQNSFVW